MNQLLTKKNNKFSYGYISSHLLNRHQEKESFETENNKENKK